MRKRTGELFHIRTGNRCRSSLDEIDFVCKRAEFVVGKLHYHTQARRHQKCCKLRERKIENVKKGIHILQSVQNADGASDGEDRMDLAKRSYMIERTAYNKKQFAAETKAVNEIIRNCLPSLDGKHHSLRFACRACRVENVANVG